MSIMVKIQLEDLKVMFQVSIVNDARRIIPDDHIAHHETMAQVS